MAPATHPRLGRLIEFDDRSRSFALADHLGGVMEKPLRSYTWANHQHMNQDPYGPICVAASEEQERTARPNQHPEDPVSVVMDLYHLAQSLDPWANEPHDGSTVLAGAKAAQQKGWITGYVWGFTLEAILLQLSWKGGVIMGTKWTEDMFNPDANGQIRPTGADAGGHAYRLGQIDVPRKRVWIDQTWEPNWGINGRAWLSWDDLDELRKDGGEAIVPVLTH